MQKCKSLSTTGADYTFQAALIILLHAKSQLSTELCKIMHGYDKIMREDIKPEPGEWRNKKSVL